MQNVRAIVKVMEFQSLCIVSGILTLLFILVKPLQQKLTTGAHPVTLAPLVGLLFDFWQASQVNFLRKFVRFRIIYKPSIPETPV